MVTHRDRGGLGTHIIRSGKVACLCVCEDRGASPTLTAFVNFQILSTIIHRLSSINSWLITQWSDQQSSWLISQNPYQQSIADNELIVHKVVLYQQGALRDGE